VCPTAAAGSASAYYQTGGAEGAAPRPGSMLGKMQKLYTEVLSIADPRRDAKLLEIYQVHIDEGPITIGTVGEHPSPIIVGKNLANVPANGLVAGWTWVTLVRPIPNTTQSLRSDT
jgi:hypothetical protein